MTVIRPQDIQRSVSPSPAGLGTRRLPHWFKVKLQTGSEYQDVRRIVAQHGLHTICEEARCPNVWECWNNRTATFLILGDVCTRRCHYCSVTTGRPHALDAEEPQRVAEAVRTLGLRHAVITSVNRDELEDGGATVFADTIRAIRDLVPSCTVEVLIPDFQGSEPALNRVMEAQPDILNHNIETVPRLFPSLRPQGKYARSLTLLSRAAGRTGKTKSGLMVGMGESPQEVREVLNDLRSAGCQMVSIGQYLQPTKAHVPVSRFYTPEEFQVFRAEGLALGFDHVESGPLVRSSYHAEQQTQTAQRGA